MEQRKRRRLVGRIITTAVLLGVATLIVLGFMPKPVPVAVAKVEQRTLEVDVEEPGRTRIRSRYTISAPVAGQLARIALRAGDMVDENQVVARISPVAPQLLDERTRAQASARVSVAQANVARAQAAIKSAESARAYASDQASRARSLQAQGGTSEQALEQAEYQLRAATEELAAARLSQRVAVNELTAARVTLASMSGEPSSATFGVTAPVAGQVLKVFQESEGVVQPGTPLLEVGDPRALEVVVDVLSTDAVRIEVGAEARIERWGGGTPLPARVRRKEPSAFTTRSALGVEEQRVPVLLDLVAPPEQWSALGDGYRVEAHILLERIEQAIAAPASALFRDGDDFVAFVVRGEKAARTEVVTGTRNPDWVEVKEGLAKGDEVVLYPSDQVTDGVELAPRGADRRAN